MKNDFIDIADNSSQDLLYKLRDKLVNDNITFLKLMIGKYSSKKSSAQKKFIETTLLRVEQAVDNISKIQNSTRVDKVAVAALFSNIREINNNINNIKDTASAKKIDSVLNESGISLDDLSINMNDVKSAISKNTSKKYPIRNIAKNAFNEFKGSSAYREISNITSGIFDNILGPLAPLGQFAMSGVAGLGKAGKSIYNSYKENKFENKFQSKIPSRTMDRILQKRSTGHLLDEMFSNLGISKISNDVKVNKSVKPAIDNKINESNTISKTSSLDFMFRFWNKRAYEAKYTKELMSILKKKPSKKSESSSAKLNSLLGKLGPALMGIAAPLAAIAGIGAAGYAAYKFGKKDVEIAKDIIDIRKQTKIAKQKEEQLGKKAIESSTNLSKTNEEKLAKNKISATDIVSGKINVSNLSAEDRTAARKYLTGKINEAKMNQSSYMKDNTHFWTSDKKEKQLRDKYNKKNIEPYREKLIEINKIEKVAKELEAKRSTSSEDNKQLINNSAKQIESLQNINKNIESMAKQKTAQELGTPNIHNSADTLLDSILSGQLVLSNF